MQMDTNDKLDLKQNILIVDGTSKDVTFFRALLKDDYTVRVAFSEEKAFVIINSKKPPDLVLFDMLTGIDGHEFCRRLKADSRTWNLPVLFIAPNSDEENEISIFKMGAADYITKPFNPVVIKARVQTHTEMKKYRDYLEVSSYRDGLTTIPNKHRFDEYFDAVWGFAMRESMPLSIIKISIDNFTQYNASYGHQAGDACLIQIAGKLSTTMKRKSDVVARYGREEFICVLPNTRIDGAIIVAEALRMGILSLKIPHAYSAINTYATINQGVATVSPTKDLSPEALLLAADEALEKSKEGHKNQINCKSI